jgi:hypothetical protein
MSSELTEKLKNILKDDIPNRHSFFQLDHFIIKKEPTIQAQLWQCLRELRTRNETIEKIKLEIEETKDRLELLNIQEKKGLVAWDQQEATEEMDKLYKRELEINVRQLKRQRIACEHSIADLEKKLSETLEETEYFVNTFEELSKIEELKPFDDPKAQQEYWNERLRNELNMRILLKHPIDIELAKTILSLNDATPIKRELTKILMTVQKQEVLKFQQSQEAGKLGG